MRIGGVDDPDQVDMDAWRRLGRDAGIGAQLPALISQRTDHILGCADALLATAKAEAWRRPVIDRIGALIKRRARQVEDARLDSVAIFGCDVAT